MRATILPGFTFRRRNGTWSYTITAEMSNGMMRDHIPLPLTFNTREAALESMMQRVARLNRRLGMPVQTAAA